jgi:large subunit ribosomal protein L5
METAVARLKKTYQEEVAPQLMKRFNYTSKMQLPRLSKIIVNVGVSEAISNAKALDKAVDEVDAITGQKPVITQRRSRLQGSSSEPG